MTKDFEFVEKVVGSKVAIRYMLCTKGRRINGKALMEAQQDAIWLHESSGILE